MKQNSKSNTTLPTPYYIVDERLLRNNLQLIHRVANEAGIEIILAFKAFALWKLFPIFREYIHSTTASSLSEARLAFEEFGAPAHTYSPAYTDREIEQIAGYSSHLTFNSLTQYARYHERVAQANDKIRLGLRVNPRYSEVGTLLYNPCAPGTRFGVTSDKLPEVLPQDVTGFHCHCHCESGADVLQRTLVHIERQFGRWFEQIEWLNLGGGHLMTRKDYDVELLVDLMQGLHRRYPWLKIILEPGSAFAWQTGDLVAGVVDVVEDKGIKTAIMDVSFTCHMPDCLEMPYHPSVRGAECLPDDVERALAEDNVYRLGGNSCLSGDFMGYWQFDHALEVGEQLVFEDMIHYTTVKTNMFNGISHPTIALKTLDGTVQVLRAYDYTDYKGRMD
ncbi:MAG: carboxynorspermidine decarboxylase [Prevotella sp.]